MRGVRPDPLWVGLDSSLFIFLPHTLHSRSLSIAEWFSFPWDWVDNHFAKCVCALVSSREKTQNRYRCSSQPSFWGCRSFSHCLSRCFLLPSVGIQIPFSMVPCIPLRLMKQCDALVKCKSSFSLLLWQTQRLGKFLVNSNVILLFHLEIDPIQKLSHFLLANRVRVIL